MLKAYIPRWHVFGFVYLFIHILMSIVIVDVIVVIVIVIGVTNKQIIKFRFFAFFKLIIKLKRKTEKNVQMHLLPLPLRLFLAPILIFYKFSGTIPSNLGDTTLEYLAKCKPYIILKV